MHKTGPFIIQTLGRNSFFREFLFQWSQLSWRGFERKSIPPPAFLERAPGPTPEQTHHWPASPP